MKYFFILLVSILLVNMSASAFADCASDKQQALAVINSLKATAINSTEQANADSEKLGKLVDSLSSQNCSSELLEVYRTMQREGVTAN